MLTLLHLSDLHLEAPPTAAQVQALRLLLEAIERELSAAGEQARAVVITGDVFDTSSAPRQAAAQALQQLCEGLRRAAGPGVPILILPGNHDRRRAGVIGPEDLSLFRSLARVAGPDVHVFGNDTPFLAELVAPHVHGLPFHVVACDSTVLPGGLISAGGYIRQEDLLQIASEIEMLERAGGERRPLLLLMHHHLIPTPLTDLSHVEMNRLPRPVSWLLERGLRHVVAHGDREELTMTALGAGTALSTLGSFGRPILVLHGHKHYPTARLLKGVRVDEGDILIGSAGSSGRVSHWRPTELPREARVWPSFNRVRIDGARVTIDSIAFSDRKPDKEVQLRRLVSAAFSGPRWELSPAPTGTDPRPAPFQLNESVVTLHPNEADGGATWDAELRRTLRAAPQSPPRASAEALAPRHVDDVVEGLPDGAVHFAVDGTMTRRSLPARVPVPIDGQRGYRIERAACRTLAEGGRRYGKLAAHEWMGLLVRHATAEARLTLVNLPEARKRPFGSTTSLTSGEERVAALTQDGDGLSLVVRDCPPLALLRIYWPL